MSIPAHDPSPLPFDNEAALVGLRLLIVEDEFVLAAGVADVLEDAGAQVLGPVSSVESALALIDEDAGIDAAVLDVDLGSETVFPLADVLLGHGLPFVFATGYTREQLPPQYRDFELCTKPFTAQALSTALARMTRLPGPSGSPASGGFPMNPPPA